jgi:hypothetical protein
MMEAQQVSETSVLNSSLTRLVAQEDFSKILINDNVDIVQNVDYSHTENETEVVNTTLHTAGVVMHFVFSEFSLVCHQKPCNKFNTEFKNLF